MFPRVLISNLLDSRLRKRNTMHGMVADVSSVQSALNIFTIAILMYLVCSQIFALALTFQEHIIYLYFLNLSWGFSKKSIKNCVPYNFSYDISINIECMLLNLHMRSK
jgi:uncharacterized protein YebE (UPF0316 family)